MLLPDLRLVQRETELLPNRRRKARQPIKRVDKPNQLTRVFRHTFIVCQNWHKAVIENCSRNRSSSRNGIRALGPLDRIAKIVPVGY